MHDEARRGLRGIVLDAPFPHPKCGQCSKMISRRWSAVSQRVPRDAHQRFVKTDVLGKDTASREKRCRVCPTVVAISEVRERKPKSRRDPEGDQEK
jgi:hypothetical protein